MNINHSTSTPCAPSQELSALCLLFQEEPVQVDKTKEMNERLLVEVRRRLQAAKSQLNSAPPSEADAGTPVDSPLGGRPTVLQNRTSAGKASALSVCSQWQPKWLDGYETCSS